MYSDPTSPRPTPLALALSLEHCRGCRDLTGPVPAVAVCYWRLYNAGCWVHYKRHVGQRPGQTRGSDRQSAAGGRRCNNQAGCNIPGHPIKCRTGSAAIAAQHMVLLPVGMFVTATCGNLPRHQAVLPLSAGCAWIDL
jgi:hypothetical protein